MARFSDHDSAPILDAIVDWRDNCLLDDGSLFSDQHIWTKECLGELDRHFVQAPDPGTGSFIEKLKLQIGSAPSDAKKLAAEMFWVMFTFPSKGILAETKRKQIKDLWSWSGEDLESDHRLLGAPLEYGVGSPGQGYHRYRWAELSFFISAIGKWKNQSPGDQKHLLSDPWIFGNWLDGVKNATKRQLRHTRVVIYEENTMARQKFVIPAAWAGRTIKIISEKKCVPGKFAEKKWKLVKAAAGKNVESYLALDTRLQFDKPNWARAEIKHYLERKFITLELPDKARKRFWVELTKVSGRPGREHGEHALGKALWSPQTATDGRGIYKQMREVSPGDIVLHLIDKERISGVSVAETSADDTFMCLDGTEWAGRSGYRIQLSDYVALEPPIDRDEFFEDDAIRAELSDILQHHEGLFYNKNFKLNQGTYLTEAPIQLVQILNKVYREATGQSLPHLEELEPLDTGGSLEMTKGKIVWLISPGEGAFLWEEWQAENIISIGWDEIGDLHDVTTLDDTRARISEVLPEQDSTQNARACYEFAHVIQPGDIVFAKMGRKEVIGYGQVSSHYRFDDTRSVHQHVRDITWLRIGNWPYTGERMFPMKALTDITRNTVLCDALMQLVGVGTTEGEAVGYKEPPFEEIVAAIKAEGMRLPEETVARYHLSLKTRGFVILSGNSGTGKTWLADAYARAAGAESLIVPVAPNWTTNEDLLGYFNPLDETYHDTPFSAFLKRGEGEYRRARENGVAPRPFHLILDEMNLARVEYYFAKFLSAMEIRARPERRAEIELSPGKTVQLPPNLFFVGTVNVDETTHAFADKVYDRAQMLEIQSPRELIEAHLGDAPYADLVMRVWDAVKDVAPFAYRVIDEIGKYVEEALALGIDWRNALDHQLEQKVLTKVKGADPRIEAALNALIEVSADGLPGTHAKAQEMLRQYEHHGFTSFF